MTSTLGFVALMPSTIAPVPSGEPSSTTSTSRRASRSSTWSMSRAILSRSLYVGMMTSPLSDTTSSLHHEPGGDERERHQQRDDRYNLSSGIDRVGKGELYTARAGGERDSHQRVVGPSNRRRTSVDHGSPPRVPVLGHDECRSLRSGTIELDLNLARRRIADTRTGCERRRGNGERTSLYRCR